MSTYDRHLSREWLGILFLVLATMLGLLLAQICYDDLRPMLEAGAHLGEVLEYLFVTLPSFCAIVLPLAMLISLLFTLTKLHRANEITALRAAGAGILRITAPVWIVGVAACGLVWWLNSTVVPWSVEASRTLEAKLQYRHEARTIPPDWVGAVADVAFDEPEAARIWFMNRFSQETGRGYGVSVTETDANRRPITQILAAVAWRDAARGGWEFQDGRALSFDPETGRAVANEYFKDRFVAGYREDPELMLLTDQRPGDLSFFELRRLVAYFERENPAKAAPYAVLYYRIIADTFGPLIVIAIAIPFSITGARTNPVVGVSKSIGLFFLYYLLTTLSALLSSKGWLDPEAAAWIPNLGITALAIWFFAKMR